MSAIAAFRSPTTWPTTPHAPNEIPDDTPYSDEDWPEGERDHAQITWTNTQIGRMLARLEGSASPTTPPRSSS